MKTVTVTRKVGLNKGARRIWLDGRLLAEAGFVGGTHFFAYTKPGKIVLALAEVKAMGEGRVRKVTGRPDGKPIIDMVGAAVENAFPEGDTVTVKFAAGRITITE